MSMVGEQTARKHGIANDYSKEPSFLSTYFMLHMRQKFVRAASSSQGPPRKALKLPMNDPVRPADLESAVRHRARAAPSLVCVAPGDSAPGLLSARCRRVHRRLRLVGLAEPSAVRQAGLSSHT